MSIRQGVGEWAMIVAPVIGLGLIVLFGGRR
jgi:hypothetical protein